MKIHNAHIRRKLVLPIYFILVLMYLHNHFFVWCFQCIKIPSEAKVTITVSDKNDNPPVFVRREITMGVTSTADTGHVIVDLQVLLYLSFSLFLIYSQSFYFSLFLFLSFSLSLSLSHSLLLFLQLVNIVITRLFFFILFEFFYI